MKLQRMIRQGVILACISLPLGQLAWAQNGGEHWVATWAASPQQTRTAPAPAAPAAGQPAAAPAAPTGAPRPGQRFNNQTVRMIVRTSIGGRRVRVQLSNAFGAAALVVGAAHVATRAKESEIAPATDRALTFSGKSSATIPVGASMVSDAVDLDVPALGDLAVSVFFPSDTGAPTTHSTGLHTTYISKEGNFTAQPVLADTTTSQAWYFLSSVDVLAPAATGLIVAYGDSITDGATSTVDTDHSWPSLLAARLAKAGAANVAVVNQGISGNRILRDNAGVNALARFDRDVLSQEGVKWLMILEGINDIGQGTRDPVTAEELIAAQRQLIERAHMHGIKVIGCTLTPYKGASYYSDDGEIMRVALNNWILTSGAFDATVDFDAATRDPNDPKQIRADFNIRDHLHPNDAGYQAMANAIDLSVFGVSKSR
jgi:lysophospholipase L1-like esterase